MHAHLLNWPGCPASTVLCFHCAILSTPLAVLYRLYSLHSTPTALRARRTNVALCNSAFSYKYCHYTYLCHHIEVVTA